MAAEAQVPLPIELDCAIVGAGWTGTTTAAALKAFGVQKFALFEAGPTAAHFWAGNYDRIQLHTPWHSVPCDGGAALYEYPMFKSKRMVLSYLQDYLARHNLEAHTHFNERVVSIKNEGPGQWLLQTDAEGARRSYRCRYLAICTSKLRVPLEPATLKNRQLFAGRVLHSREFRNGRSFAGKDVVVAGTGNSGAEISAELVEQGARSVTLLAKGPRVFLPLYKLGRMAWIAWYMGFLHEEPMFKDFSLHPSTDEFRESVAKKDKMMHGLVVDLTPYGVESTGSGFQASNIKEGRIGTFDQGAITFIRSGKIKIVKAHISGFTESSVLLDNDTELKADVVILATGFGPFLEEFLQEPERFLARGQEGKGIPLSCLSPLTDGRSRSTVDDSLFFPAFDQAANAGTAMGFWGWSTGFLMAQRLGLVPAEATFGLDMLPERQKDVIFRRNLRRFLFVASAGLATGSLCGQARLFGKSKFWQQVWGGALGSALAVVSLQLARGSREGLGKLLSSL